jgi:UDP-N-acetylglucosamine 2-epimerase (non-hydrolysing)
MEAGNRSFDQNLPEEINRTIVDHIADINLPYTEHARRYLLSEGVKKEHIFVTGSPMREVLVKHQDKIAHSQILSELQLKKGQYLLVSATVRKTLIMKRAFFP